MTPLPDLKIGVDRMKLARVLVATSPKTATPQELVHLACTRWDDLKDKEIGTIVTLAREMRGEKDMPRQESEEVKALKKWVGELVREVRIVRGDHRFHAWRNEDGTWALEISMRELQEGDVLEILQLDFVDEKLMGFQD